MFEFHYRIAKKVSIFILLTIWLFSNQPHQVTAQNTDNTWATPVNLSHSGSTTDPKIVVDPNGTVRVIWADTYAGIVYSYWSGNQWSTPAPVSLPSGAILPRLISSANGEVHAFWLDGSGRLSHSYVNAVSFNKLDNWSTTELLAESVVGFDLSLDANSRIHLVYISKSQSDTNSAGVYYQRSNDSGHNWSSPRPLFLSPYFRSLTPARANISIAIADINNATQIYAAWDNTPRKQVLLARSQDNGGTWETPVVVAEPLSDATSTNPFHIQVSASEADVLIIWQDGDASTNCNQYYQFSSDRGNTWNHRQALLGTTNGCAQENQLFTASNNLFILKTTLLDGVYLLAFDGNTWSDPQAQDTLSSFADPETFNTVSLGCQESLIIRGNSDRLYVVGCDTGGSSSSLPEGSSAQENLAAGAGDIWFLSRPVGTISDWFPKPPIWSAPVLVTGGAPGIFSPKIVSDAQERLHAFWIQENNQADNTNVENANPKKAIYYTRWDNSRWWPPTPIVASSTLEPREFAITLDKRNQLLIVWCGSGSGEIFFSKVDIDQAGTASNWSTAQQLPSPDTLVGTPTIIVNQSNTIFVAFAVPLNEGRGIYITQSDDNGKTWSQPVQVFDAASAGWSMVDNLHIALSGESDVHLMWARSVALSGSGAQALYYTHSADEGITWSEAQEVVEKHIVWSDLVGLDGGIVHRVWQEDDNGQDKLWHQISLDNGKSWSQPASIATSPNAPGPTTIVEDSAGQLHLLEIQTVNQSSFSLQYWYWQGDQWLSNESSSFDGNISQKASSLTASISLSGKLSVLYGFSTNGQRVGSILGDLSYISHNLTIPTSIVITPNVNIIEPTITPTMDATNIPASESAQTTPTASPTLEFDRTFNNAASQPKTWGEVVMSIIPAVIIVGFTFGMVVWRLSVRRR